MGNTYSSVTYNFFVNMLKDNDSFILEEDENNKYFFKLKK